MSVKLRMTLWITLMVLLLATGMGRYRNALQAMEKAH